MKCKCLNGKFVELSKHVHFFSKLWAICTALQTIVSVTWRKKETFPIFVTRRSEATTVWRPVMQIVKRLQFVLRISHFRQCLQQARKTPPCRRISYLSYILFTRFTCSCRWGEKVSLNCSHQRIHYSSHKWYMSMCSHGGMILTGKTEELGEKTVLVPLCPLQIPHGLTGARIRVFEVRGRQLTGQVWSTWPRMEGVIMFCMVRIFAHCIEW
jgi:hypothetical protein